MAFVINERKVVQFWLIVWFLNGFITYMKDSYQGNIVKSEYLCVDWNTDKELDSGDTIQTVDINICRCQPDWMGIT